MDIGLIGNFDYKNYLQSLKLNGSRDIGENFFTSVNEQIKIFLNMITVLKVVKKGIMQSGYI